MAYTDLIEQHESIIEPNVGHEELASLAAKRDKAKSEKLYRLMVNRLVEHNMRLVIAHVRKNYSKFDHDYLDQDDIIQAGNLGLMRAAEKWNPTRSKFSTYAMTWIRSMIQDAMYKRHTIHLPRQVQKDNPEICESYQSVSLELCGEVPVDDVYFEEPEPIAMADMPVAVPVPRVKKTPKTNLVFKTQLELSFA